MQHLSKSLEFALHQKDSSGGQNAEQLTKWLEKLWCQKIRDGGVTHLWFETTCKRTATPTAGMHHLALRMMSLGAFTASSRFVCHWKSERTKASRRRERGDVIDLNYLNYDEYYDDSEAEKNVIHSPLMVSFEHDNDLITMTWNQSSEVRWRMEISFDSLTDRIVLMSQDGSVNNLYLFIINQPKIYRGAPRQRRLLLDFEDDEEDIFWERDVCFGSCSRHVIGSSNAIHLEIDPLEYGNIDGLLQRLNGHGFSIYVGNPATVQALGNTVNQWPQFNTFEAIYAWYCLITRGFKVTDQISDDVTDFLRDREDEVLVARLLHTIGDKFDNNCVVSLCSKSLQREWDALLQFRVIDDDNEDQQLDHLVKVPRILLTPTVVRGLPAEHIVGNRVVREFGVDRFVRVALRDEDMELLSASACSLDKAVAVITEFMHQDLVIGRRRRYHFLGCSNSQMREHGFWMYASDGKHTVDSIRQWMGDLSHERCVAAYVSRLGQFFSASKKTISVDAKCKRLIPDVELNGHCFTDGIGKISSSLAGKVNNIAVNFYRDVCNKAMYTV